MSRQRMTALTRGLLPSLIVLLCTFALMNVEGSDFLMHFSGGVAIAWGTIIIVKDAMGRKLIPSSTPPWLQTYLAFSTAAVAGILWEFHEWAEDFYFLTSRQPDLTDTMSDFAMDLLGAIFIILVLNLVRKYKRR